MKIVPKKNKMMLLIATTSMVIMMSGCKKLIEIDPPNESITTGKEFESDVQANSAIAGLYSRMAGGGISNGLATLYSGLSSDEFDNTEGIKISDDYQLYSNSLTAQNANPANIWAQAYSNIFIANAIIEGVSASTGMTDAAKVHMIGEAKFLRAYHYYYLVNFFGDVPLVIKTNFKDNVKLPRTTQQEVYGQIVQDLIDAQAGLPDNFASYGNERVRVTKAAATSLLARIYLYTRKWNEAEQEADKVISDSQFILDGDLQNVFKNSSKEAIFQLKPSPKGGGIFEQLSFVPLIQFSDAPPDVQASYTDALTYELYEPFLRPIYGLTRYIGSSFEPGDKRKAAWVGYSIQPNVAPYKGDTLFFSHKYKETFATGHQLSEYITLFRLAELYLIRAEARAQQGDVAGAASDINEIRQRAGLDNTRAASTAELLPVIALERKRELFAEGHRWFDLKRTGKAKEILSKIIAKRQITDEQLLYPLPTKEIINDPLLIQNPGY